MKDALASIERETPVVFSLCSWGQVCFATSEYPLLLMTSPEPSMAVRLIALSLLSDTYIKIIVGLLSSDIVGG
jgi:hypothetical protein